MTLGHHEAHVWVTHLDLEHEPSQALVQLLSEEERARAQRFQATPARRRFVLGRSNLRILIGVYLQCNPAAVQFSSTAAGKLFLTVGQSQMDLRFNLSHSADMVLFAFTQGCEIGVDIEQIQSRLSYDQIAQRCFAPAEVERLRQLPPGERESFFYRCWTRWEAWLKGLGVGIAGAGVSREIPADWQIESLTIAAGYEAAVAVACPGCDIQLRTWTGGLG